MKVTLEMIKWAAERYEDWESVQTSVEIKNLLQGLQVNLTAAPKNPGWNKWTWKTWPLSSDLHYHVQGVKIPGRVLVWVRPNKNQLSKLAHLRYLLEGVELQTVSGSRIYNPSFRDCILEIPTLLIPLNAGFTLHV